MKRSFFKTLITAFMLMLLLSQAVVAMAITEVIETPNHTQVIIRPDPPEISASFKDNSDFNLNCIYTGEEIKPEIVVKKQDGTIASPSEYKVTYDKDCKKTGDHMINVEYLETGYKCMLIYKIIPGLVTKMDMTAKNGKVTLSWAPVKGAVAYRIYKRNAEGKMAEVWLPNGEIAAEGVSRTFTDLEPGKTYEMGIMALDHIHSMPTDQMKTFKFTVPKSGEGSLNVVPGNNPTTAQKTTKQTTVKAPVQKTTQKATTAVTTTEAATVTTTVVLADTTTEKTTEPTTTAFIETIGGAETTSSTEAMAEADAVEENSDEDSSGMDKTVILLGSVVAVVIVVVIVVSVLIKKKK